MTPVVPVEALPAVLALDPIVIAFVKNNLVTLGLFLGFLKGLAKITPGTTDDKIVTLLTNLFLSIKPEKINRGVIDKRSNPAEERTTLSLEPDVYPNKVILKGDTKDEPEKL